MKNFVLFTLLTISIAAFGQTKQEKRFCYVGVTLEQIQKDFQPSPDPDSPPCPVYELTFEGIYKLDFLFSGLSDYKIWVIPIADCNFPNYRMFYIKDGKCEIEALITEYKTIAAEFVAPYWPYLETLDPELKSGRTISLQKIKSAPEATKLRYDSNYSNLVGNVYTVWVK